MPQLNSGKRKRDNAIAGGVLMGLDVDDKWTLKEAKEYFTKENIKTLLITTPSHQKEVDKSGKKMTKRDRFRVIILLDSPFTGDAKAWSNIMTNYMAHLNQVADTSCKDISRFFYPSPSDATYYYIAGEPLNWRSFAQDPPQPRTATSKTLDTDYWERKALEKLNQEYNIGNRDNTLRDTVYMLQTNGVSSQRAYEIVSDYYNSHPTTGDKIDIEKFRKEVVV